MSGTGTELTLERTGTRAVKNERGDILLREDALSYLEAADLGFYKRDKEEYRRW